MIIGVDMDVVMNRMMNCWIQKYNSVYGSSLQVKDITHWDISKFISCSMEQMLELLTPDVLRHTDVQDDAPEVLNIINQEHKVFVVSAAYPETIPARWEWIQQYFPYLKSTQLAFLHDKSLFNAHVLIDDGLHNFSPSLPYGLVFDQPWNQSYLPPNLHRVHDWSHIARFFAQKGWI